MKIILTVFSIAGTLSANAQGIMFENNISWNELKMKAKLERKYIFVDAHTTWCGPCIEMGKTVFTNDNVGHEFNPSFLSVKLQMDRTKSDKDEVKNQYQLADSLNKAIGITAFPTLLYFSPEGKLVHRSIGFKDKMSLIKEARFARDPDQQYYTLREKFTSGDHSLQLVSRLAPVAKDLGDDSILKLLVDSYVGSIGNPFSKESLDFINRYSNSTKDKGFDLFFKNIEKVNSILGKDEAEAKVTWVIEKEHIKPLADQMKNPDWSKIKQHIRMYGSLGEEILWQYRVLRSANEKNWKEFSSALINWYPKFGYKRKWLKPSLLNNMAWTAFENLNDKLALEAALQMINVAMKSESSAGEMDTKANILYKLNRKLEALKLQEEAVALDPENSDIKKNLKKMQAGLKTWP